jgi:hypothetical protein
MVNVSKVHVVLMAWWVSYYYFYRQIEVDKAEGGGGSWHMPIKPRLIGPKLNISKCGTVPQEVHPFYNHTLIFKIS